MDNAVLLITFNRPQYVSVMLSALKKAETGKLYVFKDGPRPNNNDDEKASKEIEKLISGIDWPCSIRTNYMQNNLGCGFGPYSAISWAFQYENELIILEDDCIPSLPFFSFCSQMLEKYKNNEKVRLISGRSQLSEHSIFQKYDYIFSQYAPTWGWATWKRTWKDFDMQMRELNDFFKRGGFTNQFSSSKEADFFNRRYKNDKKNKDILFHVWDHQFSYHGRVKGAFGIVPAKNLIKYIGIEGTHSSNDPDNIIYTQESSESFSVKKSPQTIALVPEYDREYFYKYVYHNLSIFRRLFSFVKRKIKSLI